MNVYTYYEPIIPRHEELVDCWMKNWERRGFNPTIISSVDFFAHPLARDFDAKVSTYPTTNDKRYDRACFRRWLAMAQVGGGLLTDYDVLNFGFSPADCADFDADHIHILGSHRVPCAVFGTRELFLRSCGMFMDWNLSGEDFKILEDMHCIQKCPEPWIMSHSIAEPYPYGTQMTHCASAHTTGVGLDRWKLIKDLCE